MSKAQCTRCSWTNLRHGDSSVAGRSASEAAVLQSQVNQSVCSLEKTLQRRPAHSECDCDSSKPPEAEHLPGKVVDASAGEVELAQAGTRAAQHSAERDGAGVS